MRNAFSLSLLWLYKRVSVRVCSGDLRKWQKCHTRHLCSSKNPSCLGNHRSDKLLQRSRGRRRPSGVWHWQQLGITLSLTHHRCLPHISCCPLSVSLSVLVLSLSLSVFRLTFYFPLSTSASKLWHSPLLYLSLSLAPSSNLSLFFLHLSHSLPSSPLTILSVHLVSRLISPLFP